MTRRPNSSGTQQVSVKTRFLSKPTLVSFGVAAAIIVLLVWRLDLDLGETWETVRGMDPWLYVLALAAYYLSFVFRGARWRILARNAGVVTSPDGRLPSIAHASGLIIIGWFVNSIAWLRLGDAYRAYAFAEDARGSFPASLGTVLAERVVDMSIVLVVLVVSVFLLSTTSDSSASRFLLIAAFVLTAGLAGLLALMKRFGAGLARFLPGRLEAAYHRFHQGTLGSLRRLPLVLTLGLAGWLLEAARLFLVVQALGLSVPLALVPIVALGHAILSTVPTPGGVGAVEPGVTGLLLLELGRNDAVSVALVDRSITYLSIIVFGGLVFAARQLGRSRRDRHVTAAEASGDGDGTG